MNISIGLLGLYIVSVIFVQQWAAHSLKPEVLTLQAFVAGTVLLLWLFMLFGRGKLGTLQSIFMLCVIPGYIVQMILL